MSTRSFKSVGWVAGVGAAALGCYMLSLQVAAERADLANVEQRIVAAQQEIRSLQTELGTRGRLQQLEQWNADVLALSSPAAGQFVENEVVLARLETRSGELANGVPVRMASVETAPVTSSQAPEAPATVRHAVAAPAPQPAAPAAPMVRRASLTTPAPARTAAAAPERPAARPAAKRTAPSPVRTASTLLDERTTRALGEAARGETRTAPTRAAQARTAAAPARTPAVRRPSAPAARTQAKD